MKPVAKSEYVTALRERAKKGRVTQQFQLIGLEIAIILRDLTHKALYIKYAKEHGVDKMLALAKDVASRRDVQNRGAYFMKVVQQTRVTSDKSRVKPETKRPIHTRTRHS